MLRQPWSSDSKDLGRGTIMLDCDLASTDFLNILRSKTCKTQYVARAKKNTEIGLGGRGPPTVLESLYKLLESLYKLSFSHLNINI